MSKYVEVDALAYLVVSNGSADFINKVTKLMIEAPSIDIVRCKECKHWDKWRSEGGACCKALEVGFIVYRRPDDFCSSGEREDE